MPFIVTLQSSQVKMKALIESISNLVTSVVAQSAGAVEYTNCIPAEE